MVRITCTISVTSGDEHTAGSYASSFDEHYKRVVRSGDSESGHYKEECDDLEVYEEQVEEAPPNIDLAAFFSGCSLHGANHVFVEEKKFGVRQGLWAVSFLTALCMFLIQVGDRVVYYTQYDHITMLDERNAPNMTFPAITMCNYNNFRRSQISYSDLLFMGPLIGYEDNMAPGFQLAPEPDRQGARFSLAEFYNRTRHRMDDMLLECNFAGKDCGPEHWREVGQ
ncbi:acid-sensing ion channel 1B isoform X1 [Tachysurus ichikawai]